MNSLTPVESMRLLRAAVGLLPLNELQAKARRIIADEFEPKPAAGVNPKLTLSDFMRSKGVEPMRKTALRFGVAVRKAYVEAHGCEPMVNDRMCVYRESDRPLMESVWTGFRLTDGN